MFSMVKSCEKGICLHEAELLRTDGRKKCLFLTRWMWRLDNGTYRTWELSVWRVDAVSFWPRRLWKRCTEAWLLSPPVFEQTLWLVYLWMELQSTIMRFSQLCAKQHTSTDILNEPHLLHIHIQYLIHSNICRNSFILKCFQNINTELYKTA